MTYYEDKYSSLEPNDSQTNFLDKGKMNEHVATYYYDMKVEHGVFDIYACYDSYTDYTNRNVSFYDVYNKQGVCVNEGDPFYQFPKWEEIFENYYQPHVM